MLSYEKCCELRDAGFPQRYHYDWQGISDFPSDMILDPKHPEKFGDRVSQPTLTELIEACGLPFDLSCRNNAEKWYAFNIANNPLGKGGTIRESPEEAVANLWLGINKKQT